MLKRSARYRHPQYNPSYTLDREPQALASARTLDIEAKRQELLARHDWLGLEKPNPLKMTFVPSHERDQVGRRRRLRGSEAKSKGKVRRAVVDVPKRISRTRLNLIHPASRSINTEDLSVRVGGSIHGSQNTAKSETQPSQNHSSSDQSSSGYMLFQSSSTSSQLSSALLFEDEQEHPLLDEDVKDVGKSASALGCDTANIRALSPTQSNVSMPSPASIRHISNIFSHAQAAPQKQAFSKKHEQENKSPIQPLSRRGHSAIPAKVDSRRLIFPSLPLEAPLSSILSGDASSAAPRFDSVRSVQAGTTVGKGTPVKSQNEQAWMAFMNIKGSNHTSWNDDSPESESNSETDRGSKADSSSSSIKYGNPSKLLERPSTRHTNQSHPQTRVIEHEKRLATKETGSPPHNHTTNEDDELWYKFVFGSNPSPSSNPIPSLHFLRRRDSTESAEMSSALKVSALEVSECPEMEEDRDTETYDSSMAVEASQHSIHQASEVTSEVATSGSNIAGSPQLLPSEYSSHIGEGSSCTGSPGILNVDSTSGETGRINMLRSSQSASSTTLSPLRLVF